MAKINWQDFEAQYGWARAVLTSSPELKRLAERAVREDWTQGKFVAAVRGTKWFQGRPESQREAVILRETDPAEFRRRVQKLRKQIEATYQEIAGGVTPAQGEWIDKAARQALYLGWTEEEIRERVGAAANFSALIRRGQLGGEAGEIEEFARRAAADYGVRVTDTWLAKRLELVYDRGYSKQTFLDVIQRMARSQYRSFADEIDRGMTVRDIAEPYVNTMAQVLELNPNSIDLFDPMIHRAMTRTNDDGKPDAMPLYEFERQLRRDPRWFKTNNAQEALFGVGREVLRQMGQVAV